MSDTSRISRGRGVQVFVLLVHMLLFGAPPTISATPDNQVFYRGVALPVDALQEVSSGALKVTLHGEVFISAEGDVGRSVALRILQSNLQQIGRQELYDLAKQAASASDSEVFGAALRKLFYQAEDNRLDSVSAWSDLAANNEGLALIENFLIDAIKSGVTPRICAGVLALAKKQRIVPTQEGMSQAARTCEREVVSRGVRAVFGGGELLHLQQELALQVEFEAGNKQHRDGTARDLAQLLSALNQAEEQSDSALFERSIAELDLLGSKVGVSLEDRSQTFRRERFITNAAQRAAYLPALKILATIPDIKRTPTLHKAVLVVLEGLRGDQVQSVLSAEGLLVVKQYAAKDDEIGLKLQQVLRRGVEAALDRGDLEGAQGLLREAVDTHGILPSEFHPAVYRLVDTLIGETQVAQAKQVASTFLGRSQGYLLRCRLGLAEFGLLQVSSLLVVVCGAVLLCRSFYKRARSKSADARTSLESRSSSQSVSTQKYDPELIKLLEFFKLKPGATLAEIKNAYRIRVKECHPDRTSQASSGDNADFIQVTATYDRLIELYERHVELGKSS